MPTRKSRVSVHPMQRVTIQMDSRVTPTDSRAVCTGSLAVDGLGNLFVAHYDDGIKIFPTGIVTTVAGNGSYGFSAEVDRPLLHN